VQRTRIKVMWSTPQCLKDETEWWLHMERKGGRHSVVVVGPSGGHRCECWRLEIWGIKRGGSIDRNTIIRGIAGIVGLEVDVGMLIDE
jgi:hypothetical protein